MKRGSSIPPVIGAGLLLAIFVTPGFATSALADPNRYLNAVREFADNVLQYGRDTYGPKHTQQSAAASDRNRSAEPARKGDRT